MSCHDIGRGMNSVVRTTITLFDEGKICLESARAIIVSCRKGVHWCDGNEGEAISYISECICGKCMKKAEKGEKHYSIKAIASDAAITQKQADAALTAIVTANEDTVAAGNSVSLIGFGTFSAKATKAKTARNPRTGETVDVPANTVPVFKAGKAFKEKVNK